MRKRRTDVKAEKGGQEWDGGGGKLRVISIWRVKKEETNSEEIEREAANMEERKAGYCVECNRAEAE